MGKQTALYQNHLQAHAKIVDFAGWDMPLHYGSQLQEHHQVRQDAGVFDVSHMTIVDINSSNTAAFLQYLLPNNIDRLSPGKALYTCMLNHDGGIIDDLIVYKFNDNAYRLVVNSGTRDKDLAWLNKQAEPFELKLTVRDDLAMLAVQGPQALVKMASLFTIDLNQIKPFHYAEDGEYFIARTGYTGEPGCEIILPTQLASDFWHKLLASGVKPCGLGARDTLRLEAGLNLYGADMDESVSPLESNLAWTIAWEPDTRDFIGRKALTDQQQTGLNKQLVGLVLNGPGVLRNHQVVNLANGSIGEITSGGFSPTLSKGIALARIPCTTERDCTVTIRGKAVPAQIIKPPFVRHGQPTFTSFTERENE